MTYLSEIKEDVGCKMIAETKKEPWNPLLLKDSRFF